MTERTILFARDRGLPPPGFLSVLEKCGPDAVLARSETELFQRVTYFSPECMVVLSSAAMDAEGVRLVEQIRRIDHSCPLLILTSSLSAEAAICAVRAGASDLLEQTTSAEKIIATLKSLDDRRECLMHHNADARLIGRQPMIGSGTAMTRVRSQLARIAAVDVNVMITGESGTGKELAAELIHQNSRRRTRPFVAVNCAAVPDTLLESELFGHERGAFTGASAAREGKLQHAAGGTLFLDEIGDMSLVAQAKILRAVDSRVIQRLGSNVDTRVQVRLIAATNQNLELLTQEKKFRQDLYYRLNVVRLAMPPLRFSLRSFEVDTCSLVTVRLGCDDLSSSPAEQSHIEPVSFFAARERPEKSFEMIRKMEIERFSVTSSKPVEQLCRLLMRRSVIRGRSSVSQQSSGRE